MAQDTITKKRVSNEYTVQFPIGLTTNQYTTISLKAELLGFCSINAFVRETLLGYNSEFENKIKKIHERLVNGTDTEIKDKTKPITKPAYQKQG